MVKIFDRFQDPLLLELEAAVREYAKYDDLRGDLCDACRPDVPEPMLAARERVADALDLIAHAREVSDEVESET